MQRPLRVLIVEDNPADTELLLHELRRAGFDPEWSRVDSEAAFLASLNSDIEVILSDYEMPEFGGLRALELLQESELQPCIHGAYNFSMGRLRWLGDCAQPVKAGQ